MTRFTVTTTPVSASTPYYLVFDATKRRAVALCHTHADAANVCTALNALDGLTRSVLDEEERKAA